MATINYKKWATFGKVHPRRIVESRFLHGFQLSQTNEDIEQFLDLVCSQQPIPSELKERLNKIAAGKYDRLRNDGFNAKQIASIRTFDHMGAPQKDFKPVVDPSAYGITKYGANKYSDSIVHSKTPEMKADKKSYLRSIEYRKEAIERKEVTKEGLYVPSAVAEEKDHPDSLVELPTLTKAPKVEGKLIGKFTHDSLNTTFHAREVLPGRMFICENYIPSHVCSKLIKKLDFTEMEVSHQQQAIAKAKELDHSVLRTSMRRKLIHPKFAKMISIGFEKFLPKTLPDGRRLVGIRSAMNFYRYTAGEFFGTHLDGGHIFPQSGDASEYTFVVYLNSCSGGSTRFCEIDEWASGIGSVPPKEGNILIFRQRDMKHCALPVDSGFKYIIQGMVMYSKNENNEAVKPSLFRSTACIC
mmetsp:Transcript_30435/g.52054  ORF Transcript_30435/g.52054 Transcript_30435/m.52054 type:complete len:413 (+) Transcript_30435:5-1243(+)